MFSMDFLLDILKSDLICMIKYPGDKSMTNESNNKEDGYRALFEQASDYMLVTDFSGTLVDANASTCMKFGYTKGELLQMHITSLLDPEELKIKPIMFELLKQGEHIFNERRMILRDGSVIEVEANVKKISDTRLMAIVRDVTERNMAKAHLQRTYERLNYHLNNTPLAVIEEDKDFKITYWNRQAEEIFGWKADEVRGRRIVDFMVFEADTAHIFGLAENLGKGISHKQPNENRNYTKAGNVLHCEWYHSLLRDEQGRVETILSIVRDITDVRRKEEKLEKFLELLKELSFVTSHELRNEYAKVQSVLNYLESAHVDGRSLEEKDKDFLLIEATRSFYNINDVIGKLNAKIYSGQGLFEE